jgi:hypothetical protein
MWVTLKEFPKYQINEVGQIRNINKLDKLKKLDITHKGYMVVTLYNVDGITYRRKVHRLVAQTFIPNQENKPQVNHINGNKQDNRVENLEWVTASENIQHAIDNGLNGNTSGLPKKVKKYSLDGKFIAEYPSMLEAAYQNECHYTSISSACKGKQKTCKGFKWAFSD